MTANEVVQRLSERMPAGWTLTPFASDSPVWLLAQEPWVDMPSSSIWPESGDMGLAPLTTLLKQEIGMWLTQLNDDGGYSCSTDRYWDVRGKTEFEAVADAYLATKNPAQEEARPKEQAGD